ncbi:hypothetical protein ACQAYK_07880 [Acidithiobacillus sp. AC3]
MANILVAGVYMADRKNLAKSLIHELSRSSQHTIVQRWIALTPSGRGICDLPSTEMILTDPLPKFMAINLVTKDATNFDWLLLCDDDIEVEEGFLDIIIGLSEKYDFAVSQPARTVDSYTDHPIVQLMPGLRARRTRFVEIGPLVCIRRDAMHLLLPFSESAGMGWGLDLIWPKHLESAEMRMGIVDAAPVAHRLRPPANLYDSSDALQEMFWRLAGHEHLTFDDAFTVLEAYSS